MIKIRVIVLAFAMLLCPLFVLAKDKSSPEEVIRNLFPTFQEYKIEERISDNQQFKIFTVFSDNQILGWTVVVNEMGKIKPITFLVGIDKEGKILGIYVLEYRDMFGDQIRRKSFLKQFKGKSIKDAISIGRDIDAVTGATISSQAATLAVRKSLKIVEELKIDGQVFKESIK